MDVDCLIRKFDNKDYDDKHRTAEEMDEVRHKTMAYEYLCHLEEARLWLEACLKENLPPTTDLEENLRNGVYLAKLGHFISPDILPVTKIYDIEQKRYKIAGLQFRHTDNINYWLNVLRTTELPLTFHPETTDVYDKKNMPRVIYCIHALSTHLFKLGRAPLIQDLYGKATFTDEEIDAMSKELKRYGITMPAFQKIGGLLSSNLDGNVAALHAAVINVNQAIDSDASIESSLLNPAVKLKYVLSELSSEYHKVLRKAKKIKVRNTLNKSMNDSYIPDVYDELLTQGEIQGYITSVNFVYTWKKIIDAVNDNSEKALLYHLSSDWLQLKFFKRDNIKYYMEHMKSLDENLNEIILDNVIERTKVLQIVINKGNSIAETYINIDRAVKSVNSSLDSDGLKGLYQNLLNLKKYATLSIDEFALPLLYEEMKLDKMECGKDLCYEDILSSTQVLTLIASVSKAADQCNFEELWKALNKSELHLEDLHPEFFMPYCRTVSLARQAKIHAQLPCSLLTFSDIQDCIDEVNQHEDSTKDLIHVLNEVSDAVRKDDVNKLMSSLKDEKLNLRNSLFEDNSSLYLRYLKVTMKKKGDGELWLDDIQNTISEIAEETRQVQTVCNVLTKVNLAVLQIDASSLMSALEVGNFEIIQDNDVNRHLFEIFLEFFESKNSKNMCPWIVHHTKSGKTVYVNIELNSYSWDTPRDFLPNSRYLSMKDVITLIKKSNKNNIQMKKRRQLEQIIGLQAHIRGFLVRRKLLDRILFLKSKSSEIIKIQAWWKSILVQRKYNNILREKRQKRQSIKKNPQDLKSFYKSKEKNIIRIQALWRGRCARRAFISLFHQKSPPFKVVKHFVPILDFSTEDYEKEIQLQSLRAEAVQAIRKNQQLSKQLDELDLKIGLLVQNRISLQDVVIHRTKINDLVKKNNATLHIDNFKPNDSKTGTVKNLLSTSTRGLKALTRESRKLLDGYQHLFYLLQTNPVYLSKLLFCLPQSSTNQFLQNVILTLYNFGSNTRDEYLLLKLFRSSLEEEINCRFSKPLDVITGNPIVLKMAVHHARQMSGLSSLRSIVGPLVEKMISDRTLSIDTSPVDIYKTWRNRMESQTGQISALPHTVTQEQALAYAEVKSKLHKGLETLKETVTMFLDRITECGDKLPFTILYMARVLHYALSSKFPQAPEKDILKVIGHLVYYQFINAAIVAPDAFDIVTLPHDKALSNDQRRNLASVAKILHFSASKKGFGEESAHLQCLNPFIIECHEKMKNFFRLCCHGPSLEEHFSVDEYSEATLLYKPVIYISVQEICDTHSLLVEYEDVIATDPTDRLHELLDILGPTDPCEVMPLAALAPVANTEVCLTLVDKFQLPADDMTDINKLFIKTKELCVSVLPFLNGDHLLEALCIGTTKEQQDQYKSYIQQKLYSGMIKPNEKMTLREHISQLRKYLNTLEDEGYVTRLDGYQSIVTAIALDLCNKGKYRRSQLTALQMMKKTKQSLDQKTKYYEEQCDYYNQYINKCLENLNTGKRTVHSLERKGNKMPGKVKSKLCVKYSASKLFEKGILIEIDGLTSNQFKNVMFEITPTDHNGIFNIKGKFLGVEVEKMELDVQHLLQLQYDGCSIIDLFGKAKINVNLFLFLLNTKFYGKTK